MARGRRQPSVPFSKGLSCVLLGREEEGLPSRTKHILKTIYRFCYHKAYLSILRVKHNREYQFKYVASLFLPP